MPVGVNADVGRIEVRSLLIVSAAEAGPGRFLGSLFTSSQEPVEVTIADQDDDVVITVEGGATHQFDSNPAVLASVSDIPGSRVPLTVTAGTHTAELQVPVLDGTLDQNPPYLPTASQSPWLLGVRAGSSTAFVGAVEGVRSPDQRQMGKGLGEVTGHPVVYRVVFFAEQA